VKNTDIEFDYSATEASDDVVRSVAAEMTGGGLKPLTDDERVEWEIWREEQALLAEQRAVEYRERQTEQEAVARAEHAAEIAERNRKARQEYLARQDQQARNSDLAALRLEAQQSAMWRNTVQNALAYQARQTLINEMEAAINPPPPEPEQVTAASDDIGSPNIADDDFNAGCWLQKPIFR
jgi:hypothetical protein